jgi:mono/diheme cytochrome c family protein
MLLALTGCNPNSAPGSASSRPIARADDHPAFLARHWQRPLSLQGTAASHYTELETSLAPASCGTCHIRQFEDWKTALHSQAMSPGLFGQLQEMGADAAADHQACIQCHAPLAEQAEHLQQTLANPKKPQPAPPRPDGVSHVHGLTCAGCHVRNRQIFGPPRKDGSAPASGQKLPHDGWQATDAFQDSRFCAACHQFEADGPALNGKLLENTYEEWRVSRYAREGRSCQSCHMPDRRHLWRGIHDPGMVKSGLRIETSRPIAANGQVSASLQITSHGVGHAFPSYVTPRVIVEIGQESRKGKMIPASVERHLIARDVSLDLQAEKSDTRIMPDEIRRYAYGKALYPDAVALTARIRVEPDAFYADFYRATLADPEFQIGRKAISEALRRAEQAPYVVFHSRQEITLPSSTPK